MRKRERERKSEREGSREIERDQEKGRGRGRERERGREKGGRGGLLVLWLQPEVPPPVLLIPAVQDSPHQNQGTYCIYLDPSKRSIYILVYTRGLL